MTKCPHCGAALDPVGASCPACGKSLLREAEWEATRQAWGASLVPGQSAVRTIRLPAPAACVSRRTELKLRRIDEKDNPDCDFQLLDLLGQGGMGLVYRAKQNSIARPIALKMMRPDKTDEILRDSFLAEALVTGHLDHPNVVPIYELGVDETGRIFYAMKELRGTLWSDSLCHKPLRENLEILLRTADAVAFAHSRNVIHRDLKPQNVMLGDYGEVVLLDWGLAASTSANLPALRITPANALCGTPAYMPPEMARGQCERIGPASDVYLLGAILFEIVAGQPPHITAHDDPMDALTAAAHNKIAATAASGELLDVARRAMATEPSDRFASVKDFQTAIRVFLGHQESAGLTAMADQQLETARASRRYADFAEALFGYRQALRLWPENAVAGQNLKTASREYAATALDQGDLDLALSLLDETDEDQRRLARTVRQRQQDRNRQAARIRALRRSLAFAGALVLAVATAGAVWINRERIRAVRGENAAREALAESRRHLSNAFEAAAAQQIAAGQDAQGLALLAAALRENPSNRIATARTLDLLTHRDWVLPAHYGLPRNISIQLSRPPPPFSQRRVTVVETSRTEARMQVLTTNVPPVPLGSPIGRFPNPRTAWTQAAVSPDGRFLAFAAGTRRLHLFDRFRNQEAFLPITLPGQPTTLSFSPTGEWLVLGFGTGLYRFLDLFNSGRTPKTFHGPERTTGVFLRDKSFMALYASTTSSPRLVDYRPGAARAITIKNNSLVTSAAFTPDGNQVVLAAGSDGMSAYSAHTGKKTSGPIRLRGYGWISTLSPDGRRFAAGTSRGQIGLGDVQTGLEIARRDPFTNVVRALAFDPDGRWLAAGGDDRRIEILDAHSLETVTHFAVDGTVRSLALSPGGRYLLAGVDHVAMLWDLEAPEKPPVKQARSGWVRSADFSPDGTRALWGEYRAGHLFDLESQTEIAAVHGHFDAIWLAQFSPDGRCFATVSYDGFLRLWSARDGTPLTSFLQIHDGTAGGSSTLAFSSDSQWVAAGSANGLVRIWDVASGREVVSPLRLAGGEISSLAFSADAKRLVAATRGGVATVVELVPTRETPAWLPELAEAVGGLRATESGFDPVAWSVRRRSLAELLERAASCPSNSLAHDWLGWILADRGTRMVGPWSMATVSEIAADLRQSMWLSDRLDAVAMEPHDPAGYLQVAELLLPLDTSRAAFWLALARDLDPALPLTPVLESILASAPFDDRDPPGPAVFEFDVADVQDFTPYVHKDVVLTGTVEFVIPHDGHTRLLFKNANPQFYGFIPHRILPEIEKAFGGKIDEVLRRQRIRLRGVLMPYEDDWEIVILGLDQIERLPPDPANSRPAP